MARSELKIEFGRWLDNQLTARGVSQAGLRKLLQQAGITVNRQAVSQWINGENIPLPDTLVLVAQILDIPPAEALRKAGHPRVAELTEHAPTAGTGMPAAPPVDPIIQNILDDPAIPSDLKGRAIAFYRRKMQQAKEDLQDFGLSGPGDS